MTESLFSWYLDLNLLLAFAYLLWLGMKPLSRWSALRSISVMAFCQRALDSFNCCSSCSRCLSCS